MTMESLFQSQCATGKRIEQIYSNYKKDSQSRKTRDYLQGKLQTLSQLWDQFESTDTEIRTKHPDELSHPYFSQCYYDQIKQGYEMMLADIESRLSSDALDKSLKDSQSGGEAPKAIKPTPPPRDSDPAMALPTACKASNEPHNGLLIKVQIMISVLHKTLASLSTEEINEVQYFKLKINTIERHWADLRQLHGKIWQEWDNPVAQGYDPEAYFSIEEEVNEGLLSLYARLDCLEEHKGSQQGNQSSLNYRQSPVKLPKVALQKFDGDYLKWRQFRDLFTELIHNQDIADCHKMWYLKTSLQGEAERLIRHFTICDANYNAAWKVINDRYENKRLLVTALISKLMSQPSFSTEGSSSIRALHDTTQECLLGLQSLSIEVTNWDPLILFILIKKLDRNTHTLWEQSLEDPRTLPSLEEFLKFLETRFQSLEALGNKTKRIEDTGKVNFPKSSLAVASNITCLSCKGPHQLYSCNKFLRLSPTDRLNVVKTQKLCINCLKPGHNSRTCKSRECTKCALKHNTLLHIDRVVHKEEQTTVPKENNHSPKNGAPTNDSTASLAAKSHESTKAYILLGTVLILISTEDGATVQCRAILDSGSQLNFLTEKLAKRLKLRRRSDGSCVEGIGQGRHVTHGRANVIIQSRINNFKGRIEVNILPQIVSPQPTQAIDVSEWPIPQNIIPALADPQFNEPQEIDLLIGAELFYSALLVGQIKISESLPVLQNTIFGWTVSGKVHNMTSRASVCAIGSENEQLNEQIEKFWRLEDIENTCPSLTNTERQCENHFSQTHRRDSTGRFIIRLPMLSNPNELGESKDIAYRRFLSTERKLIRDPELKQQYTAFMHEYERLGHMKQMDVGQIQPPYYFLPHHAVMKPESNTTKLRVVFDGSAKTPSGRSLNDILHVGPVIQDDVFSVLLRFRLPRYAFTADIEKMYRQIQVHDSDQRFQLIWWRDEPDEKVRCFRLTTVTYGTACAPYIAVKCLRQLANQGEQKYPLAARAIRNNFYVDDVLAGSNSLSEAIMLRNQLQSLLQEAGFNLRKWCSNHPALLPGMPEQQKELSLNFNTITDENVKTMGLVWSPKPDEFRVNYKHIEHSRITKRTVISDMAHLFDPLGIMGPVVVVAKIFSRKLWELKTDWDAALPQQYHTHWSTFKKELLLLNNIAIPRHIFNHKTPKCIQVHIFSDASEQAFGAVAYIRSIDNNKVISTRLLCAKSKIAPIKQQTLPRLELCAAKLGAELAERIKSDLHLDSQRFYFWTDSEITLAWINSTSSSFQTFVANRVASIQRLTLPEQWRHVSSNSNPADVLSRGTSPEKLASDNLWFYGPVFLHGHESAWPAPYEKKGSCKLETKRSAGVIALAGSNWHFINEIDHRNSFKRLNRIVAYILRFISRLKAGTTRHERLTAEELENARIEILKFMQAEEFKEDLKQLQRHGETHKSSAISSLTPFIDSHGIIRVGGRLEAASIPQKTKHPVLLPYVQPLTKMILNELHLENRHVGPQGLLAITRQDYWPIKGKTLVRSVVQNCVFCSRAKPRLLNQLMGDLPPARVQQSRPFNTSGVDFCGPVWVHFKIRGKRPQKAYIAVFCCFSTKAVHLELVSDLTTEGFIGALKRFTSRRGHCRHIYCDNGTNLVGAKNQLQEVRDIIESKHAVDNITAVCASKGTDFHLIPPRSPHFGGLWEAAVKSAKHLLKSTLTSASITYEEMSTVVAEVEAILNSRPLTPLSPDPNDFSALTPGHFLIGEAMTSAVEAHAEPLNATLITRWKLVTQLRNEFWRRWHNEYLNQLQCRTKWKQRVQNVKVGTMVIVKEDNIPPLQWKLGRIMKTYSGNDGLIRVVDVRTSTGIFRRPIHNLAPLPIATDDSDSNEPQTTNPEEPQREKRPVEPKKCSVISPTPKKKLKMPMGAALLSLLLCLICPAVKASPVEVVPFNSNPGIYFENLGPSNIITSEWSLVAYYNMGPYWKEFQLLQDHLSKLQTICNSMTERGPCKQITNQIQHSISDLSQLNELLQKTPSAPRTRRGAINVIGNIANALFGVLDSEYAEQMSATIDKIEQNEVHLSELAKNQTSMIDATINIMQKSQEAIRIQFEQLENHINTVTREINGIKQENHQENLSQLFTFIAIQTTLLTSNFYRIQNAITDVMVDTHHGRISPQLIHPSQLLKQITNVKQLLKPSLQLPASTENILNYYNFLSIKGRIGVKHIIFQIKIPLLSSEQLELFHMIPVPVRNGNEFFAIQPSFPYLMLNLHRDQYYPLTEHELSSCISLNQQQYICKQIRPMYRKGSAVGSCELTFINEAQQSSSCRIAKVPEGPHWIQLQAGNQWIFSLERKTTINMVCNNNVTQFNLEGSGILKMKSDCTIKQKLLTIQGHTLISSDTKLSYIPSVNLTDSLPDLQNVSTLTHVDHYSPHLEELESLKRRLSEMQTELPAKLHLHNTHQYAVSYGSLLIILVIAITLLWLFRRTICKRESKCHPNDADIEIAGPSTQSSCDVRREDFVANFDHTKTVE